MSVILLNRRLEPVEYPFEEFRRKRLSEIASELGFEEFGEFFIAQFIIHWIGLTRGYDNIVEKFRKFMEEVKREVERLYEESSNYWGE